MSTIEDMADFVQLWDLVSNFSLTDQSDDIITWRWIVDGEYSDHVSSTIQLSGSFSFSTHPRFGKHKKKGTCTRKAKVSSLAWLLVQCKILTADKLMSRNWPCNRICTICDQEAETPAYSCFALPICERGSGEDQSMDK